ncbi:MAG: DUF6544 family protein [Cyclobacteriaceae bacterium]
MGNRYAGIFGFVAMIISQILIFYFWQDAKFGTIPNLIILITIIFSYANVKFEALVEEEKTNILLKSNMENLGTLSAADVKGLPDAVKKWLVNSGAIGKKMMINGKIVQKALMKTKPEQEDWKIATAIQYCVIDEPALIWTVDLKMNPFLRLKGRDKFQDGKGEMLIKMNSLVNVVHETGEKIDEGTIQRYLGEMVWFPSLAVSPYVSWEELDGLSARATMTFKNTTGAGTFYFKENGDFIKFVALRFMENKPGAEKKEWVLTVDEYGVFDGIKVPSKMKATWNLENGDWTWLDLEILKIQYNINPKY